MPDSFFPPRDDPLTAARYHTRSYRCSHRVRRHGSTPWKRMRFCLDIEERA